jgi:hypothetical protein
VEKSNPLPTGFPSYAQATLTKANKFITSPPPKRNTTTGTQCDDLLNDYNITPLRRWDHSSTRTTIQRETPATPPVNLHKNTQSTANNPQGPCISKQAPPKPVAIQTASSHPKPDQTPNEDTLAVHHLLASFQPVSHQKGPQPRLCPPPNFTSPNKYALLTEMDGIDESVASDIPLPDWGGATPQPY